MNKKRVLALSAIIVAVFALSLLSVKLPVKAQTSNQTFQLSISGLVQNPMTLTLEDVKAMPQVTEYASMYCVDAPSTVLQAGDWTGVQLSYLLGLANVSGSAVKVAFYATDDFTTDLNISTALQNTSILVAYQENNSSLSGFRLVVPGCWGYKWISDLTQIQLVNYNFLGTEESQGYADNGVSSGISSNQGGTPPQIQSTQPSPSSTSSPSATQNPAPTRTSAPSATSSINGTTPAAASSQKSQPSMLVLVAAGVAVALAAAAASAVAITTRRKTEASRPSQVDSNVESPQNAGKSKSGEV